VKQRLQAVVFDVGGVLLRTEDPSPRRRWEQRLGLPARGLADLVFNSPVSLQAMVGLADASAIWAYVGQHLGLGDGQLEELRADFWRGDQWDRTLLAFAQGLRPSLRTGVLSNAWPDARREFAPEIGPEGFDVVVISAEEGFRKPERRIYELLLSRLEVPASAAAFVDDMPENVAAAEALGMQALLFTTTAEVIARLRAMLR